jgi:energy-coupling factor transporter ATP-binding protein EcfA2
VVRAQPGIAELAVRPGQVFGFFGPNGAGKATTIRLLVDLIRPTSGRAEVLGMDTRPHSLEIRVASAVLWLWWAGQGELDLDLAWRASVRRFDLEHTPQADPGAAARDLRCAARRSRSRPGSSGRPPRPPDDPQAAPTTADLLDGRPARRC